MQIVSSGTPFTFNYPAYSKDVSLNVLARIYNVTTGTPILEFTQGMTNADNGVYTGNYVPITDQAYLVVMAVYNEDSFTTLDADYAPLGQCFKTIDAVDGLILFNYGSFDYDTSLNVAANVYDCTSGTVAFLAQVVMNHVTEGVYFGSYTGVLGKTYDAVKLVYTDNTYTVVDADKSPDSESFQIFTTTVQRFTTIIQQATLIGQSLKATLKESQC